MATHDPKNPDRIKCSACGEWETIVCGSGWPKMFYKCNACDRKDREERGVEGTSKA